MENSEMIVKSKSNKGTIIVLMILVLALCGYIICDKFIVKENQKSINEKTQVSENSEIENEKTNVNEVAYNELLEGLSKREAAIAVTISSNTIYQNETFVLGVDNKIYLQTSDGIEIPGAIGSDGNYNGSYIGIDNVARIFKTYHTPGEGGSLYGLLILKNDGTLYILRNPADKNYSLEKIDRNYIVDAYDAISSSGTTYIVDIFGNSYPIK